MTSTHEARCVPAGVAAIRCAGSPRQSGLMQGEAAGDLVGASHRALRRLEAFDLVRPRWLPFHLFVRLAERRASTRWRRSVAAHSVRLASRADGIADASGLRRGAVRLLNVLEPVMAEIGDQIVVPPLGGCSAIAVHANRSAAGEPVLAQNFDYLPLVQPFYIVRASRPDRGLASLDFTCAPLAGTIAGINEAGLCITYDYAYVTDAPGEGGTLSMAITEALAGCRTVEDAVDHLASRDRWGGGLLLLMDAFGDMAALELSNRRAALRRADVRSGGVLFHTNRFQTASMLDVEVSRRASFSSRAPKALRGVAVHDSAEARQTRFAELVAGDEAISLERLTAIMSDHGRSGAPSRDSICMHGEYWATTASLQFLPRRRRLRIAFDAACRATWTEMDVDGSFAVRS